MPNCHLSTSHEFRGLTKVVLAKLKMPMSYKHRHSLVTLFCWSIFNWSHVNGNSDRCAHDALPLHTEYKGLCYGAGRSFVSWVDAEDLCKHGRTRLAKITEDMFRGQSGKAFGKFLYDKLLTRCGSIGLSSQKPGQWRWTDGTDFNPSGRESFFMWEHDCAEICPMDDGTAWEYRGTYCYKHPGMLYVCQYDPVEIPVSTTWAEEERPIDVSTSAGVTMLPMFTGSGSSQATAQLVSTNMMNKATTPGKQESKRLPMRRTNPQNGNSRRSTVFRREGRALYPDGEQLWEMEAFTVTMCVRNCMSDRRCEKLAFNSASRQCHGFSFVLNNLKANVNWQIWNRW